jgi:integrase
MQPPIELVPFFERTFVPQKLAGQPQRERHYREAIDWLARTLGRPVTLADVDHENLAAVAAGILAHGFTPLRARDVLKRLRALRRHAARLGLIDPLARRRPASPAASMPAAMDVDTAGNGDGGHQAPPSPTRTGGARAPSFLAAWLEAPSETLSAMFETMRDELVAAGRDRNTVNSYAAAVHQFNLHLGRYATAADVRSKPLKSFRAELLGRGRAESLYQQYADRLKLVARRLDPKRFADRRRKAKLPSPKPGSLREFFDETFEPQRLVGCSATSGRDYRCTLRRLHEFRGGDVALAELSDRLAADFFAWLLHGRRAVSVNGHRARLYSIWRMAAGLGLAPAEPKVKRLRESHDAPDSWDESETARIIAAPLTMTWRNSIAGIPAGPYWNAFLLVAYWTGLRRGSIRKLRRRDVDLATGWIDVGGDKIKNRRGQQFRVGPDAIAAIAAIWQPDRELVFPWPYHESTACNHVRKIIAAAGVPRSARACLTGLHKLRRTVATLATIKRGLATASELLGHGGIDMTLRYVDPSKLAGHDATEFLPMLSASAAALAKGDDADVALAGAADAGSSRNRPAGSTPPAMVDAGPHDVAGDGRSTVTELHVASHEGSRHVGNGDAVRHVGNGDALDPHELLRDAARLLAAGDAPFAAWGIRAALERWVCDVGQARGCAPAKGQPRGVTARARLLCDNGFLSPGDFADVRRINKALNRPAHGHQVAGPKVAAMLSTVGSILEGHLFGGSC